MQFLIPLLVTKAEVAYVLLHGNNGVLTLHIQSHRVGREAFSLDGFRDSQRIVGLQRFSGAACSSSALPFL